MIVGLPDSGQIWRHYKGDEYEIVAVSRLENDPAMVLVTYAHCVDQHVWTRYLEDFLAPVDHKQGFRFVQVVP